ncbi:MULTISPECIES: ABC transporter substrate-binding protein [Curtobacterium]|jgi:peptide/nickel transport system substrate-binding protein|uniref:ABC transporter substrate-binding protein n=1 Tax=Curtobacterium poinsettiae TaxID=159612 RepID=A0A9Q9T265_9MICO|nr:MULTISPECIES: ABC transporter substrate-binding protein [Curtobacterium]UXN27455.1 ABC transporter substrate-binding protein [Curtobacterium flaccumfaciens]MBO9040459.1 peptide ABC transporter substrate-binding protein [Curtobacterium flaccumfaciens pv. flaccumfaciens]MCS6560461.1 ABC transporter substrate-binding protein [Curtobacterium flaccumfaciens pv. poinsettiae]MDT0234618.1 ABC transporter substrate-binding protein [Curtobacterium sp. BRB10]UYC79522.1 ABC transporter substrate-bindin
MASVTKWGKRGIALGAGAAATALVLTGCASSSVSDTELNGLSIGTTDKITSLDPAGSYDNGSFAVQNQVFPFLMNTPVGSPDVEPDIATKAEFTNPTTYEVTLKDGLEFANGNKLTSSDVKFSFDRELKINNENGPQSLLANLKSIDTPDDTTVVFNLDHADQTWPQVLSSPAGPIVDEDVFSATKLTSADDIVKGKAFAGQYQISSYKENDTIQYKTNPKYDGLLGKAKTDEVTASYYTKETDLKLAVQKGDVDVAYRSLTPTDISDLRKDDSLKVTDGPGGEIRYVVFNFKTQPFGTGQDDADEAKALAVRQAAADVVDRAQLAKEVYNDTFTPLYSMVPDGLTGAVQPFKEMYGDGDGGADVAKAKKTLSDAGVTGKVQLDIQYAPDHYGSASDDEYALLKQQLEDSGLFTVNIQSTVYTTYAQERTKDAYPVYQLGWFPDFSDADNYLSPFFTKENFVQNHYDDPEIQDLIAKEQAESDPDKRADLIEQAQEREATQISTLPLLQGKSVAVAGKDVKGLTLDASFKFRYATLSK